MQRPEESEGAWKEPELEGLRISARLDCFPWILTEIGPFPHVRHFSVFTLKNSETVLCNQF